MNYHVRTSFPVAFILCSVAYALSGYHFSKGITGFSMIFGAAALVLSSLLLAMMLFMSWTMMQSRGSAIPLFDLVKDGEEVLIRGASPHLIDVGRTNLHLLVEHGIKRVHCFIDAKAFPRQPFGEAYFKRIGNEMRFVRQFS